VKFLRTILTKKPVVLYENGQLHRHLLDQHMVDETDIDEVAREKSALSYKEFDMVVLEGDGRLSLVRKPEGHS
jgi:uncharacterized membrane protein YcaP (DUF421 family)